MCTKFNRKRTDTRASCTQSKVKEPTWLNLRDAVEKLSEVKKTKREKIILHNQKKN